MINDAYNLVIDAIMGPETDHANVKEPYAGILVTLKQVKIPIASVDVPSGKPPTQTASQPFTAAGRGEGRMGGWGDGGVGGWEDGGGGWVGGNPEAP